jgi:hypothetical protein
VLNRVPGGFTVTRQPETKLEIPFQLGYHGNMVAWQHGPWKKQLDKLFRALFCYGYCVAFVNALPTGETIESGHQIPIGLDC